MAEFDNRQGALRGADARREERLERERQVAQRKAAQTILHPDEVVGEYDVKRLLMTTLGGQMRALTVEDLAQFRHTVRKLKGKFKGGITAKQVVDLSLQSDRQRANEEIRNALPVSAHAGVIHIQTNAGPKSDRHRHHVYVQFLDFEAVTSSSIKQDKTGAELAKGKLRFDCDCGRHRFWFRYVATIGNYNYRLAETGFPKIRNPKLVGVACKHVLRVMTLINQSPTFKHYLGRMVADARAKDSLDLKRQDLKVKEVREFADELKAESYRQRRVATTEEKRAERARWASSKPVEDLKAKAAPKAKAKSAAQAKKAGAKAASVVERNIKIMVSTGAITQAQADVMLQAMKGK